MRANATSSFAYELTFPVVEANEARTIEYTLRNLPPHRYVFLLQDADDRQRDLRSVCGEASVRVQMTDIETGEVVAEGGGPVAWLPLTTNGLHVAGSPWHLEPDRTYSVSFSVDPAGRAVRVQLHWVVVAGPWGPPPSSPRP